MIVAKRQTTRKDAYGGKAYATGYPVPTGFSNRKKNKLGSGAEDLCMAIAYGEVDTALKMLHDATVDINEADCHGNHPLHTALHYEQLSIAEQLLILKCDVNIAEEVTNLYPIHIAAHKNSPECLDLLLAYDKNNKDSADWEPIDLDVRDQTLANNALGLAAREGHLGIVERLVGAGCDVNLCNAAGDAPLCMAITNGHADVVKLLLENNATLDSVSHARRQSLLTSCLYSHENGAVVKVLLEDGLSPNFINREGQTPLMHALSWQKWGMVKIFLDPRWGKGLDVNLTTPDNSQTALTIAVDRASKQPAFIRLLIDRGADVNWSSASGVQPLDVAVGMNAVSVAEILLNAGAKIRDGHTRRRGVKIAPPMVACCMAGYADMANLLLFYGAPIDAHEYANFSPLEASIRNERFNLTDILLAAGCNVNAETWLFDELEREDFLIDAPQRRELLEKLVKNTLPLSDMCRSVVRRHFRNNNMALTNILDLPQPTYIKNFLLLQ